MSRATIRTEATDQVKSQKAKEKLGNGRGDKEDYKTESKTNRVGVSRIKKGNVHALMELAHDLRAHDLRLTLGQNEIVWYGAISYFLIKLTHFFTITQNAKLGLRA